MDSWGEVRSYDNFEDLDKMGVWISAFIVECSSEKADSLPNGNIIQTKVDKIIHFLQIINPDAIWSPSNGYKRNLCEVTTSVFKSEKGDTRNLLRLSINLDTRKDKLSITDIKIALRNGNSIVSVPYEMLNYARINIDNHDERAAVLNCATAIEVMLKRKIGAYFDENNTPQSLRNYVLRQTDGFVKLVSLCKVLGISVEGISDVKRSVIDIRNRVIHGGYIPSKEESRKAYKDTRDALKVMKEPIFELN